MIVFTTTHTRFLKKLEREAAALEDKTQHLNRGKQQKQEKSVANEDGAEKGKGK